MNKREEIENFILYLEESLIPDLKESGREMTAEDFEQCCKWLKEYKDLIK